MGERARPLRKDRADNNSDSDKDIKETNYVTSCLLWMMMNIFQGVTCLLAFVRPCCGAPLLVLVLIYYLIRISFALVATALNVIYYLIQMMPAFVTAILYYLMRMILTFVANIPHYLRLFQHAMIETLVRIYFKFVYGDWPRKGVSVLLWHVLKCCSPMYFVSPETAAVMKERVTQSTRKGYDSRSVTFMIWLFDNDHRNLIQAAILTEMGRVDKEDKSRKTRKGKKCKKRDCLRQCCGDVLKGIDPNQSHTLPVKLEKLTIQVFTAFLNTFKKKVKRGSNKTFGDEELEIRLKPSSFDGACSSLPHLFQESGIDKDVNEVTKEL